MNVLISQSGGLGTLKGTYFIRTGTYYITYKKYTRQSRSTPVRSLNVYQVYICAGHLSYPYYIIYGTVYTRQKRSTTSTKSRYIQMCRALSDPYINLFLCTGSIYYFEVRIASHNSYTYQYRITSIMYLVQLVYTKTPPKLSKICSPPARALQVS